MRRTSVVRPEPDAGRRLSPTTLVPADFGSAAANPLQHFPGPAAHRTRLPFHHPGAAAHAAHILADAGRIGRSFVARVQRRLRLLSFLRFVRLHRAPPFAIPVSQRARIVRARWGSTRAGPLACMHYAGIHATAARPRVPRMNAENRGIIATSSRSRYNDGAHVDPNGFD
jgi:hypothetical protein